ncbi:hypothetical protein JTB14_026050 [Gonioctena quinquepunctata]|nr:hypothetical protein JTB14_026050 [Gonioctena quinquepunctata]
MLRKRSIHTRWEKYHGESVNGPEFRGYFKTKIISQLEELRKKYSILHSLIQKLNQVFSLQILSIMLYIFFTLLAYLLFFIVEYSQANYRKKTKLYTAKLILVFILNLYHLLSLCRCSAHLYKEAKQITTILHGFDNACEEGIDDFLEYFSNQISLSNVELTAFDMITLDIPLIFSVLRGITSYLVICVQFQYYE